MVLARPVFWESAREKWVEVVRIGDSGYGGGGVTACEKVRYRCGGGMCLGKGGGARIVVVACRSYFSITAFIESFYSLFFATAFT